MDRARCDCLSLVFPDHRHLRTASCGFLCGEHFSLSHSEDHRQSTCCGAGHLADGLPLVFLMERRLVLRRWSGGCLPADDNLRSYVCVEIGECQEVATRSGCVRSAYGLLPALPDRVLSRRVGLLPFCEPAIRKCSKRPALEALRLGICR